MVLGCGPVKVEATDQTVLPRALPKAAFLLALGSSLLLLGTGYFFSGGTPETWPAFVVSWLAILIHAGAWVNLLVATNGGPQAARDPRTVWAFRASIGCLVLGILTLPVLFPQPGSWFSPPLWLGLLFLGLFPYVPSVYGPVVIAHALLFYFESEKLTKWISRGLALAGALLLGTTGVAALVLGMLGGAFLYPILTAPAWRLVGMTFPAYVLVAAGLWKEYRHLQGHAIGGQRSDVQRAS